MYGIHGIEAVCCPIVVYKVKFLMADCAKTKLTLPQFHGYHIIQDTI